MMRVMVVLFLFACAPEGPSGWPGRGCEARPGDTGWQVVCTDGSSTTIPFGACTESELEDGSRFIRCEDGSEAIVFPAEVLGPGAVTGRVELEGHGPAPDVVVMIEGQELFTKTEEDGSFRLEGVPAGTWSILFVHEPYQVVAVEGVVVLPGVRELETIELPLSYPLGETLEEGAISEEAQAVVLDTKPLRVLDLRRGVEHRFERAAARYEWLSDGSLFAHFEADEMIGVWRRGLAIREWSGVPLGAVSGAVLGARPQEDGSVSLHVVRADGVTKVGGDVSAEVDWRPLGVDLPMWWDQGGADGFVIIDALHSPPAMRTYPALVGTTLIVEAAGHILTTHRFGDPSTYRHYSLATGDELPVPVGVSVAVEAGLACWAEDATYHCLDAVEGESFELEGVDELGWSPARTWFWYEDEAGFKAQHRAGGRVFELPAAPEAFSPSEHYATTRAPDGRLQITSLRWGRTETVQLVPDSYVWAGEKGLVVTIGEHRWLVAAHGGTVGLTGLSPMTWEAGGDHFLQKAGSNIFLWDFETLEVFLVRSTGNARLSPDGNRLVWFDSAGLLWVDNLRSGTTRRISIDDVRVDHLLNRGFIFSGDDVWGQPFTRYAPYP